MLQIIHHLLHGITRRNSWALPLQQQRRHDGFWVSLRCRLHPTTADSDLGLSEPISELVSAQVWLCDSQQLQASLQPVTGSTSLERFEL